jgi:hypothetical protein
VRDAHNVLHSLDATRLRTALARLTDLVTDGPRDEETSRD